MGERKKSWWEKISSLRERRDCPSRRSQCSWRCHLFLRSSSKSTSGPKVHLELIKQSLCSLSAVVINHKAVYDCSGQKSLVLHPKLLL